MFETLSRGFRAARERFKGVATLTEANIEGALREIRLSLLEADVEFKVTKAFLKRVKEKALGEIVRLRVKHKGKKLKVSPGEHFIKICQDELELMMGPADSTLNLRGKSGPASIMLVGLHGSGKTTTAVKLARYLEKRGYRPLLCAADIHRPAAVEQLEILGKRVNIPVFKEQGVPPPKICQHSIEQARQMRRNVVIFDTAGRLTIDEPLMQELKEIKNLIKPQNILLVCDAMMGQDAVVTAQRFNERLELTGIILTKLDGDARGGAALSIRYVTGKPIKFLGVGESLEKLEDFRPKGIASRILGFGDIVGLIKDFEEVVDEKKAEEDALRILQGSFSLSDFLEQIKLIQRMGPLQDIAEKIPWFQDTLPKQALDDKLLTSAQAMIDSMTPQERLRPEIFTTEYSRVERVAKGSGHSPKAVEEFIQRFLSMKKLIGNIGAQLGLLGKIPGMRQLAMARRLGSMVKSQGSLDGAINSLMNTFLGQDKESQERLSASAMIKRKEKRKAQRRARKKGRRKR
jgi:signal recognition particle subunit SRP54